MASVIIRDIPDDILADLDARAAAAGRSREAFLRDRLAMLAAEPVVRARYRLRGLGADRAPTPEGRPCDPASVLIRREPEGLGPGHARDCSGEQIEAYRMAKELVARNGPGDRERAIGLLVAAGLEVWEA